jgi:hypothetical protein
MKQKYFIIGILIIILGLIVSKMLKFEDALRQKSIVEVKIEDKNQPLIDDLAPELLRKIAMSSEYKFIAEGDYFSVQTNKIEQGQYVRKFEKIFLKGVNLGVALPDKFPSEFSATYDDYIRWMIMLGNMNANTLRIYTILPPEFYRALAWYNLNFDTKKLYLLQGVWAKEPPGDNYADIKYTKDFLREIKDATDVIHGNAVIQPAGGHADGVYSCDVSDYTIGFILGREWEPYAVTKTNENDSITLSYGLFVDVLNPTPMEKWLAGIMEFTVKYETQIYQKQRPVSFVNWLPLDPMYHNSEYIESKDVKEFDNDLESVDMEKFSATNYFKPGVFASYHVYPYYPDFIFQESKYQKVRNHKGAFDNYLAYLLDLKHHQQGMPLVIAEYGVPSSRGNSHYTPFGYHQGGYSEMGQAEVSVLMTENIHRSGCAGALYFEWIDEWFKNNWLVMDFEVPQERRKKWHNMENPEQNYGILAIETRKISIDGSPNDWNMTLKKPFLRADSDPAYFYLSGFFPDISFLKHNIYIAIDTYDKNLGSFRLPFLENHSRYGVEFLVEIQDSGLCRILVDHHYDIFTDRAKLIVPQYRTVKNHDGIFIEQFLLANRERTDILGDTFQETKHNRGKLVFGNSRKPETSNADVFWTDNGFLELRLTWQLLNVTDPSSKLVLQGNPISGEIDVAETDGFRLMFYVTDKNGGISDIFPNGQMLKYSWDKWETPQYSERFKPVYFALKQVFKTIKPLENSLGHAVSKQHNFKLSKFYKGAEAAVSFAFDGRCFSQYIHGLPVLKKYHLNATFSKNEYIEITSGSAQYRKMLSTHYQDIVNEGHEVREIEDRISGSVESLSFNVMPWKSTHPVVLLQNDSTPGIGEVFRLLVERKAMWTVFLIRHVYDFGSREYENLLFLKGSDVSNISPVHFEKVIRVCRNTSYWIAEVKKVSEYLHVRDNSRLQVTERENSFYVTLVNNLSSEKNNIPVTVMYTGPAKTIRVTGSATSGTYNVRGGKLYIDLIPNMQAIFEIIE